MYVGKQKKSQTQFTYPYEWGSTKWSTICSPAKNTGKIKSKTIYMIFNNPEIEYRGIINKR